MNDAFARGDLRTLARACSEDQFERLKQRIRARPGGNRVVWGKDGEGRAEIMGVRTVDAWQSKKPEDHLTQALVRFDTRQVSLISLLFILLSTDWAGSRLQYMDLVENSSRETKRSLYLCGSTSSSRRKIGSLATGCFVTSYTHPSNYSLK